MTVNPLLDFSGLPRYGSVRPEHIAPAVDELLGENRALIARLTAKATATSWDEFADPLENANERLWRAWGVVAHLHAVNDSAAIRDAYNANLPKITRYRTELAQNLDLYEKFKALRASMGFEELSRARRRIVENDLRDYRLGGAELEPRDKRRFGEIQEELAALEAKFSENLLDATNAFSALIADRGELLGVPEDVLEAAKEAARQDGQGGWKFTLHAPSYGRVMQYAENRDLREKLYRARGARSPGTAGLGCRVRIGKTARETLRVFRSGSEAVLPGTAGPGRHVPARRRPLWHSHSSGRGRSVASACAFFQD